MSDHEPEPMVISGDWLKPITLEVEFQDVNPAVLGILTGGGGVYGMRAFGSEEPTVSIDFHYPIKRTFWQWLTRKPKRWGHTLIPHARLTTGEDDD
jgi:hypothetical protein